MTKNSSKINDITSDHHIDITNLICPMTFVRTKLMIEKIDVGEVLEVRLKGKEPLENVPRSARQHGHEVLSINPEDGSDDVHIVLIKKQ
jgi:tRNA 2-thiouridine synthesizing protein A